VPSESRAKWSTTLAGQTCCSTTFSAPSRWLVAGSGVATSSVSVAMVVYDGPAGSGCARNPLKKADEARRCWKGAVHAIAHITSPVVPTVRVGASPT